LSILILLCTSFVYGRTYYRLNGIKVVGDRIGLGSGGRVYGDADLNTLYMGSGGGSGGNAKDLTTNPIGK
jgi:hypothetical protein